jgi:hypothetical protein
MKGESIPESRFEENVQHFLIAPFGRKMYNKYRSIREVLKPFDPHNKQESMSPLFKGISVLGLVARGSLSDKLPIRSSDLKTVYLSEGPIGKIGFIQEPGYKLRAVANPNRVYQLSLEPMAEQLQRVLHEHCSWIVRRTKSLG